MKAFLAACVAVGAIAVVTLPTAHAQLVIVPGVHVDVGPHPHYWHQRYSDHHRWEDRREWCHYHDCRR
jgi:hypothetical protein